MEKIFKNIPFVIAEAGVNHNGELSRALKLVDAAVQAGADAVKFQTFRAEKLVTAQAPKAQYQKKATGAKENQQAMLRKLELSPEAHRKLSMYCRQKGILFLSTPFDEESADFLEELGVTFFKVPSGELTNLAFLAHIARKKKPMIVSTGMSTLIEVSAAVETIRRAGNPPLALLHCVSDYPAAPADANLRAMKTMADEFRVPVGYSDHTLGVAIALAAGALGAAVIEKHFTLDKNLPGPDHGMSLDPVELKAMVAGLRQITSALGDGIKRPRPREEDARAAARKSVVLALKAAAGTRLTRKFLAVKRPGTGIAPARLNDLIGRKLKKALPADTVLDWEMLS